MPTRVAMIETEPDVFTPARLVKESSSLTTQAIDLIRQRITALALAMAREGALLREVAPSEDVEDLIAEVVARVLSGDGPATVYRADIELASD